MDHDLPVGDRDELVVPRKGEKLSAFLIRTRREVYGLPDVTVDKAHPWRRWPKRTPEERIAMIDKGLDPDAPEPREPGCEG